MESPTTLPAGRALGPERSSRRDVWHLAFLVMPWALVGWLWWRVGQTTTADQLVWAAVMVVAIAAVSLPLNFAWILYNVRIARRKGPRQGRTAPDFDYRTDWARRPVVADWPAVRTAATIVVTPTTEHKVFAPGEIADEAGGSGALLSRVAS